jgi:hypothetical protein
LLQDEFESANLQIEEEIETPNRVVTVVKPPL